MEFSEFNLRLSMHLFKDKKRLEKMNEINDFIAQPLLEL